MTITSVFDSGSDSLLGGGSSAGQGSGFVIDKDGHIVTNAHVVTSGGHLNGGGTPQKAKQVFVQFGDRNRVPAQVVGFDADADVALIKVDPNGLDLQPVQLSDRSSFTVGEPVAAIGSPFGEDQSLSDRRDLGDQPHRRGAHQLRDRQRDPDRRVDQPRVTRAARCSTPRAR